MNANRSILPKAWKSGWKDRTVWAFLSPIFIGGLAPGTFTGWLVKMGKAGVATRILIFLEIIPLKLCSKQWCWLLEKFGGI